MLSLHLCGLTERMQSRKVHLAACLRLHRHPRFAHSRQDARLAGKNNMQCKDKFRNLCLTIIQVQGCACLSFKTSSIVTCLQFAALPRSKYGLSAHSNARTFVFSICRAAPSAACRWTVPCASACARSLSRRTSG